jgi:hypothetical protein
MELVAKYRLYADRCRVLAGKMRSLQFKRTLDAMAREWEAVASEREAKLLEQIDRRSGVGSLDID